MHDEWLPAAGDGEDGPTTEQAPEPSPQSADRRHFTQIVTGGRQEAVFQEPPEGSAEVDVDAPTEPEAGHTMPGEAGRTMPEDGSAGEEEAHRSAVDAVDGLLDEVERALARLDDGTYGRCDSCRAVIDDARLAESPVVLTCGPCDAGGRPELATAAVRPVDPSGITDPDYG